MKKFVRLLAFFYLCLFTISCENEPLPLAEPDQSISETRTETNNFAVENVNFNDLPDIVTDIEANSGKAPLAWTADKSGKTRFWLDKKSIIKTTDSVGNITYAIKIMEKKPKAKVMWNLIATERADGEYIAPFVLKYRFKNSNRYEYALSKERKFKGRIKVFSLEEFVDKKGLALRGEPMPCTEMDANSHSNPSNGGGNGTSGPGAPSTSSSFSSYGGSVVYGTTDGVKGWVEVGQGTFYPSPDIKYQKSGGIAAKATDCPDAQLVIPVNENLPEYPSCESFEYTNLGTTGTQVAGVNGIWDVVTKWDNCPGLGVAAAYQTYYFQLPSSYGPSLGARKSADALASAFYDLEQWFRRQGCSKIMTGALARKMDEYIKAEYIYKDLILVHSEEVLILKKL